MAVIKMSRGRALVDDDLMQLLSSITWTQSSHGYAHGNFNGKKILMHRFIMGAKKADIVDHKNGNKLDNRRENLRFVTRSQNSQNARKPPSKTGFIGVAFDRGGVIKAHIRIHGKRTHIGVFSTVIEAAKAYDKEARRLFGPEARTNLSNFKELVLQLSGGKKA